MTELFSKPPVLPAAAEASVRAATWVAFTEGPAVDADGTVYFSDIINNRSFAWEERK